MPGSQHGPSILNPKVYEALRRKGMSKQRAARISNAQRHKESSAVDLAIPPHGPNALFNQPGIQSSRRRRRRLKASPKWNARAGETIIGGLSRGESGRFSSSGQPSARSTNSAARRERADARREARLARAEAMKATQEEAKAEEEAARAEEDSYIAAGATGRERQKRRAEIAVARRERAVARKATNAEAVGKEKALRAKEDEDEAAARTAEDAAPKAAGGGGGGGKKTPTEDEKKTEADRKKAERRTKTAPQAGISVDEAEFLAGAASGTLPPGSFDATRLMQIGLLQDTGDTAEATDAGRRALNALERGDVRGALAAIQDGKARVAREQTRRTAAEQRAADKKRREAEQRRRAQERGPVGSPERRGTQPPPRAEASPDPAVERARNRTLAGQIIRNLSERRQRRRKESYGGKSWTVAHKAIARWKTAVMAWVPSLPGFTVFKDSSGHDRWLAVSSTAYRDKDGEIVSTSALCKAVAAGDATGQRGPLRFWHVPGVELGDCDYQATAADGRLLIESGTFHHPTYAQALKERGGGYQVSIGFVHPRSQPDADGVFSDISIFERSIVPPGRASNLFTRITTKEKRMLSADKDELLASLLGGRDTDAYKSATAQITATNKEAENSGAVYKDAPPWAQDLATRLKALETKAPMPPEEMIEAGETELLDGEADVPIPGDEAGVADELMDDEGFADLIVQKLLAALGPQLELEKKMQGYVGEIKAALQPMAQKDDARAKELADLQAVNVALDKRLKELEGGQPRARSIASGVWGDLTGIKVSPEQAAQITAKQAADAADAPAGLTPQEQGAYSLIFGEQ